MNECLGERATNQPSEWVSEWLNAHPDSGYFSHWFEISNKFYVWFVGWTRTENPSGHSRPWPTRAQHKDTNRQIHICSLRPYIDGSVADAALRLPSINKLPANVALGIKHTNKTSLNLKILLPKAQLLLLALPTSVFFHSNLKVICAYFITARANSGQEFTIHAMCTFSVGWTCNLE